MRGQSIAGKADSKQMSSDEKKMKDTTAADAEAAPEQDASAEADPIAALAAENGELKDRLLRTIAEMENLRKRTEREIADTRSYAIANFARDMLSATDNLSRALMVLPEEVRHTTDSATKALIEGIEMTDREMQRLMQKNGVKPVIAEGERFDPHLHQAMFEVPDDSVPEGTVVQVVQAGFAIGDRILRPAMVGIAKGGPKTAGKAGPAPAAPEDTPPPEDMHIDKEA
jgi:molecular chaperone GrpE